MQKNIDWLTSKPFAHRGLHSGKDCPENSLRAFKKAVEKGIPIELDARVIADGEIVVFHDDHLERMTGAAKNIEEQDFKSIQELRLLGSREGIPTLRQVLELVNGKVPILVEIKNNQNKKGIEEILAKVLSGYTGPFAVQSFNPVTLSRFRKNAPGIIRGQLSSDFRNVKMNIVKKFLLRIMLLNLVSRPDYIAYDIRALPLWAAIIIRKTAPLILWTVRTEEEKQVAEKIGNNYIYELGNTSPP